MHYNLASPIKSGWEPSTHLIKFHINPLPVLSFIWGIAVLMIEHVDCINSCALENTKIFLYFGTTKSSFVANLLTLTLKIFELLGYYDTFIVIEAWLVSCPLIIVVQVQ